MLRIIEEASCLSPLTILMEYLGSLYLRKILSQVNISSSAHGSLSNTIT